MSTCPRPQPCTGSQTTWDYGQVGNYDYIACSFCWLKLTAVSSTYPLTAANQSFCGPHESWFSLWFPLLKGLPTQTNNEPPIWQSTSSPAKTKLSTRSIRRPARSVDLCVVEGGRHQQRGAALVVRQVGVQPLTPTTKRVGGGRGGEGMGGDGRGEVQRKASGLQLGVLVPSGRRISTTNCHETKASRNKRRKQLPPPKKAVAV